MLAILDNFSLDLFRSAMDHAQYSGTRSMQRLGTGSKLNSASDDAAGWKAWIRMLTEKTGLTVASQNVQNAVSLLQTGGGATDEIKNIGMRMQDLATQAADDSLSSEDKKALQTEYDTLAKQTVNIVKYSAYNGSYLLRPPADKNGKSQRAPQDPPPETPKAPEGIFNKPLHFQTGANANEQTTVDLSLTLKQLQGVLQDISSVYKDGIKDKDTTPGSELETSEGARKMIDLIKNAVNLVGEMQSAMGAAINGMQHTLNNIINMSTNLDSAIDRRTSTDYAIETANMNAQEILMQASSEMLKRASMIGQLALSLLKS